MRLKIFFLQILIILPLTTFGERLGYTEELVRDLYTVIKKSGTIGDLINNLPINEAERKRRWESIEKYGTENLAIPKATLKSRQIIWRIESGRRIVQDFSRIAVGEVSFDGKPISIKGRTFEELSEAIRNLLGNGLASYNDGELNLLDARRGSSNVESVAENIISWLMPYARGGVSSRSAQAGGTLFTQGLGTAFGYMKGDRERLWNNERLGYKEDFCPISPCFDPWMDNLKYAGLATRTGITSTSHFLDRDNESAFYNNGFPNTAAAFLTNLWSEGKRLPLAPTDKDTVSFFRPEDLADDQMGTAFVALKN